MLNDLRIFGNPNMSNSKKAREQRDRGSESQDRRAVTHGLIRERIGGEVEFGDDDGVGDPAPAFAPAAGQDEEAPIVVGFGVAGEPGDGVERDAVLLEVGRVGIVIVRRHCCSARNSDLSLSL